MGRHVTAWASNGCSSIKLAKSTRTARHSATPRPRCRPRLRPSSSTLVPGGPSSGPPNVNNDSLRTDARQAMAKASSHPSYERQATTTHNFCKTRARIFTWCLILFSFIPSSWHWLTCAHESCPMPFSRSVQEQLQPRHCHFGHEYG